MTEHFFERTLGLTVLALLLLFCLQVTRPFVGPLLWGIMLSVATWPAYVRVRERVGGRPRRAAALMALLMVVVLVVPIALIATSLADQVRAASGLFYDLTTYGLPPPPVWLVDVPLVGPTIDAAWRDAITDAGATLAWARPYITAVAAWILARGADVGFAVLEFILAVVIAGVLFAHAEMCVDYLGRFVRRIGGAKSLHLIEVAARTIQGVALGIVGTSLFQGLLAAIAYVLAGIPGAGILFLATFLVTLMQMPTALVILPVAVWEYFQGEIGWAIFIAVWGLTVVNTLDNFVRPYLISQGADLPFGLIFVGVVGGLLAYGFIGIFIGPTMLAVVWRMATDWLEEPEAAPAAVPAPAAPSPAVLPLPAEPAPTERRE